MPLDVEPILEPPRGEGKGIEDDDAGFNVPRGDGNGLPFPVDRD